MVFKNKFKLTNKTVKTSLGVERVYKGLKGGKFTIVGNKVTQIRK